MSKEVKYKYIAKYLPVANRGHGDDGPVERLRHRDEHRPLLVLLPHVGQAAEDEHPHDDDQHEQTQLLVTGGQGYLDCCVLLVFLTCFSTSFPGSAVQ